MRRARCLFALVVVALLAVACASGFEPPEPPPGHPADPEAASAPPPAPLALLEVPSTPLPEDPDELSRGSRIPDRGSLSGGMHEMHTGHPIDPEEASETPTERGEQEEGGGG